MKIAYVIINANRHEGTSRAVLEVAERLASDHEIHLWARRAQDYDESKIQLKRVPGPGWPSVLDLASFVRVADRQLKNSDYDIIHCAGVNTTLADVYTVQTIQIEKRKAMLGANAHRNASFLRRFTRDLYDRRVIAGESKCYTAYGPRGPRGFAPVAEGTKGELLQHYPVSDAELSIIPNAADLDKFNPNRRESARRAILERHGFQPDDFLLLFSGGEWRRKGLDLAIESLCHIPDPRVKLLIAGTDPVSDEFSQMPERLGVSDRVVFAGFCRDIADYYAACDLFLFPTIYEAFSLATIEAAASGLPVLMSNVSGAKELVGSDEAGEVIERDAVAIADKVQQIVGDPAKLERLRHGARHLCETYYSWDRVTEKTLELYERVLNRRMDGASSAR